MNYSREWMLNKEVFRKLCSTLGKPEIDLFASRVSKQIKKDIYLKTDPFSMGRDAFQTSWSQSLNYAFPNIQSNRQGHGESPKAKSNSDLGDSYLGKPGMVPKVARNEHSKPNSSPKLPRVINESKKGVHPLLENQSLRLVAWNDSGKRYIQKEYQEGRPNSPPKQEEWEQILITNWPGESLIVGAVKDKLIPLDVI